MTTDTVVEVRDLRKVYRGGAVALREAETLTADDEQPLHALLAHRWTRRQAPPRAARSAQLPKPVLGLVRLLR